MAGSNQIFTQLGTVHSFARSLVAQCTVIDGQSGYMWDAGRYQQSPSTRAQVADYITLFDAKYAHMIFSQLKEINVPGVFLNTQISFSCHWADP